jgi:Zn-dependent peptidase ImmA (M78 family)
VIDWAEADTRAAPLAARLHEDLGIALDRPVDVFSAVRQLGVVLAFSSLGPVWGMYMPRDASSGILLNEKHPQTRQRYTAGHELGHHVFGHAAAVDFDLEASFQPAHTDQSPDYEKEAEAFGDWFLMPKELLLNGLDALGIDRPSNPYEVYALSQWLGTSYTATARHLAATQLVSSATARAWASVATHTIKRAVAGDLAPDDLRNDMWWLDGRHRVSPVEARPGDRLVVILDENPSTGYSWEFAKRSDAIRLLKDSYEDDWEPQPVSETTSEDIDLDGAPHPRCFLLEIASDAERGIHRIAIVKEPPWGGEAVDEFKLQVSVKPSPHGAQLSQGDLALTA